MRNVRLFYKKGGPLRFVSHLDMSRCMTRILKLSGLEIWHTEGFHKHPYIAFALPLSLGFFSEYEIMDFRLTDDDISLNAAKQKISEVCPEGIEVIDLREPVEKPGKIGFADFKLLFLPESGADTGSINEFFSKEQILITKKSKKGIITQTDIKPKIKNVLISQSEEGIALQLRLPAGSTDNINPKLITDCYFDYIKSKRPFCRITRTMLLTLDERIFV